MRGRLHSYLGDRKGAVAPLFALMLVVLIGIGGLAWDVSRAYALRAELEAAVDAAALAGATQLDGSSGARARATAAAQGALVQNSQRLANAFESNVAIAAVDVTFLQNLTSRTPATSDANATYIQIDLTPRSLGLVMGAIVGASGFNVTAHAVAGYGAAVCNVPPLMICNPDETGGNLSFFASNHVGKSLLLTPPPGGNTQWGPGNFGFLSPDGAAGAPAIREGMGRHPPRYACFGTQIETQPGDIANADDWFNVRFDIYRASASGLKDDPFYPPALNTMIGVTNNGGNAACTPAVSAPNNVCPDATALAAMGLPLDCGQTSATPWGTGEWNVQKYFATNHSGINPTTYVPPDNPNPSPNRVGQTGWASYGPVGVGTAPTRYQVYEWEKAILAGPSSGGIAQPSGSFSNAQDTNGNNKDHSRPQCFTGTPTQLAPDRRTITATVVNCKADDIRGRATATAIAHVDLFLTHPAEGHAIYGEVIEATTNVSSVGQTTQLTSVRLYE